MLVEYFRGMAHNNAWSSHRLHAACARLSEAELKATRVSFFPSIYLTLSHILVVDWYYLEALTEGGRGLAAYECDAPYATLAELTRAQRESDQRLIDYCTWLTPDRVAATVTLVRPGGRRLRDRVQAVLSHLFVHEIHHRGQVHAMLAGTPVQPPQLDEFFLAEDAPLRADELRVLGLAER